MKTFRKIIFWSHLITGVIAGIIILIMSVTGVALMYEKQMLALADRGYWSAPPSPDAPRLPVESLVAKAREAVPDGNFTTLTVRSDPTAPTSIVAGPGRTLYLNPYTGNVLGEGSQSTRRVMRVLTDWHRWLAMAGENRAYGRAITGACNLGFLFMVVSGIYLWWPKSWSWSQLRNITWFKRGLPGKARDFNWHNVIGLCSAIPLFIVVLGAVPISYPWASDLVYRMVGEEPPARPTPGGGGPGGPGGRGEQRPRPELQLEGVDQLIARAGQQVAGWQTISFRLPTTADATVSFSIDQGNGGQPQKRAQLSLNRQTGEVAGWQPFASQSLGRRIRTILRFAHTGEVLGFWGQTIAGIVSAGGAVLVYTGIALALRRLFAWLRRMCVSVAVAGARPTPSRSEAELVSD